MNSRFVISGSIDQPQRRVAIGRWGDMFGTSRVGCENTPMVTMFCSLIQAVKKPLRPWTWRVHSPADRWYASVAGAAIAIANGGEPHDQPNGVLGFPRLPIESLSATRIAIAI
jgi:hypothetical protein